MLPNKIGPAANPVLPVRPTPAALGQGQGGAVAVPNQVFNGQMPASGTAAKTELRQMGQLTYSREAAKLSDITISLFVPDEFIALLGDFTKVSLHRVEDTALSKGTGPYQFIGRDPADRGRALVNIEQAHGPRWVCEVTFNFKSLPLLAKAAHAAPML